MTVYLLTDRLFYFNSCVKQRVLSANFAAKMKLFFRLIHTQHSVRNAEPCSTSKYFFVVVVKDGWP